MSRRLSNRVFLPVALLVLVVLFLAVPARAQDGATHAGCDALACVESSAEMDCPVRWVSLPVGQPAQPILTAEDLAAAIPHAVRVTKKSPWDDGVCESYTWDPVTGTCTGEPAGCLVPEPGALDCGSNCFCVNPGDGFEVEQSPPVPWQLYGTDGPVEWKLQPNRFYLVSVPIGVKGLRAHHLFKAFDECTIDRVSRLACDGTMIDWAPGMGPENDFALVPGEAYGVWTADVDCVARGRLAPRPTHVPGGCNGSEFIVRGEGTGGGYSWGVDTFYDLPYGGMDDPEAEDPNAPGAGPGATAAEEVLALVRDINAREQEDVAAQVDRSTEEGDRLCVLGRPRHPVLWIAPFGLPSREGCDVNDRGPCDLEGASIELVPFAAPVVWLDRELVHWTDTADLYDVIYGRMLPLRMGEGFQGATEGCLVEDTRELEVPHDWLEPEPGEDAYWFLVRAANAWNVGFYDQDAEAGLVAPRDPGIQASGNDCP